MSVEPKGWTQRTPEVFYNHRLRLTVFRNNGPRWWYRKGTHPRHHGPFTSSADAITAAVLGVAK